jgi:site-specific DNA-methyltransferase (cytosine-N4-specific)
VTVTYRVGDTRDLVRTLADGSVSLVATSSPFIALRSYLPDDHPAKHAEIGSEPDPATFVDCLLELVHEWGRVLAPWGSIAIELGDSYSGVS